MAKIREGGGGRPKGWKMAMAAIPLIVGGVALVYRNRPQDPILDIEDIKLSGFNLHASSEFMQLLAVLDIHLTLFVRIVNPNIAPITFDTTILDVYYKGSILGQAKVRTLKPLSLNGITKY